MASELELLANVSSHPYIPSFSFLPLLKTGHGVVQNISSLETIPYNKTINDLENQSPLWSVVPHQRMAKEN